MPFNNSKSEGEKHVFLTKSSPQNASWMKIKMDGICLGSLNKPNHLNTKGMWGLTERLS
jgi:hypothetical protein